MTNGVNFVANLINLGYTGIKKGDETVQFYEKLIFVMNLTQTTNRELALAAQVDPSIISRFRSGKRGIPRNLEPVSYTHLDVYKRQSLYWCFSARRIADLPAT